MNPPSLLIKNATLVTMNPKREVLKGDLWIEGGRIRELGRDLRRRSASVLDATGKVVLPGFVQTHVHLCQTLMRGAADDLALLDWLKQRIWPFEAAHDEGSLKASAQLGLAELIRGGTTTLLSMETVHQTDVVFEEARRSGLRAIIGKCFMNAGSGAPKRLLQPARQAFVECEALHKQWHDTSEGRIRLALAPRFILSCTEDLLRDADALAREWGVLVHTHASENRDEVRWVRQHTGCGNIEAFDRYGMLHKRLCLAHCVWTSSRERRLLREKEARVLHCPSSNLKLGSGIAPIWKLHEAGVSVSLGADGAACNNNLDMFQEMRLAALLQKSQHGPQAMPAATVLEMATLGGARALGLDREIGSLEVGKRADVILVGLKNLHSTPHTDPVSSLVYSARSSDVDTCLVDGRILMKNKGLLTIDHERILRESESQFKKLAARL
jgi:cytosine/adenosine deaminase-related metal-dependent hydrolase